MHFIGEPIETTVAVYGKTESVEVIVNGKRLVLKQFDERTALFGDMLVGAIEKAVKKCEAMCENESLNTVTTYRINDDEHHHWFN